MWGLVVDGGGWRVFDEGAAGGFLGVRAAVREGARGGESL